MQLSLSNVIDVSVSETPAGVGAFNTSNLALFTADTPLVTITDGYKIYLEPGEVATDFGTGSDTYKMANSIFSQRPNILAGGGYLVIIPFTASEKMTAAIPRTKDLVQYFGCIAANIEAQADMLAAAAIVQALNKVMFVVSKTAADIDVGGKLDLLRTGLLSKTRGLFYGAASTTDANVMLAAYAARALSTNFSGSNTTQTMHLKDLIGVQPDPSMTQTLQNKATAAGVDTYISLQGVSKVFTSGENKFFDQVYNLEWLVGALRTGLFNLLAQTSTKLPQTEKGMDAMRGVVREICETAVANGYFAPGSWTSATTFGNQDDFTANILQVGYYIYSTPVSKQLAADRAARVAPLVQLAGKEAGAIHSASIIVNINA